MYIYIYIYIYMILLSVEGRRWACFIVLYPAFPSYCYAIVPHPFVLHSPYFCISVITLCQSK